jgi:peptidoglycan/LPS O-acetylase OafA/YrhL
MKLSYLKELDGVRAIAALLVMFFHFFNSVTTSNALLLLLKKLAFFGQTGVSLFFVLSGFLITRILVQTKTDTHYFSNFYIRRSLRIFPLYYFYLILVFFLVPILESSSIAPFGNQIYHWLYLQDFAITFGWDYQGPLHFWSLAVEEHFYLFFPLLIFYLNENQILRAIYVLICISIAVRFCLVYFNYETFYFTFSRMDELALGALLAMLERQGKLTYENNRKFVYLFVLTAIPTVLIWTVFSGKAVAVLQVFKYTLVSVSYFCVIGYVITIKDSHLVKHILKMRPLLFTGKISYGLYVYHGLCFVYFDRLFPTAGFLVKFLGNFALAYLVSSASYYFFEAPFLNLKSKFLYQKARE